MKTPETREELYLAFRRLGYQRTIDLYGIGPLTRRFTARVIVDMAWHAHEVDERTNYRRRRQIESLVCATY